MKQNPEPAGRKPRVALLLATAFGLGYLPKAPGTWGSLGGVALAWILWRLSPTGASLDLPIAGTYSVVAPFHIALLVALTLALAGVWAAGRAAEFFGTKDPQKVVIDEVSGQQITLLLGGFWPGIITTPDRIGNGHPLGMRVLTAGPNWKYLLLGLILFRVFDIWKPFPVRQAESLPGGWGIMADDWIAAIYAALGLWLARALGL
jgi:phosphatidylglycerophosphatase A